MSDSEKITVKVTGDVEKFKQKIAALNDRFARIAARLGAIAATKEKEW